MAGGNIGGSGYQGFDWADNVSACSMAWQVTREARYADVGVKQLRALLEDIDTVGDGARVRGRRRGGRRHRLDPTRHRLCDPHDRPPQRHRL